MKVSVCIESVFKNDDFFKGIEVIKNLGINSFEFWTWWNKDINKIKQICRELEMEVTTFCTKMISLVDSNQREEYINGLEKSINIAKDLNCKKLITQVGNELKCVSREEQHNNIVEGLKKCVPLLEDSGITLLVEPLNTIVDHQGYFLYNSSEAFEIIDEVGSPMVKVLFDIYHQQIMEGNLIANMKDNIDKIGHFHAAGNPGRHELSSGEINYYNIIKYLKEAEFKGYFGLEYFPEKDPIQGLKETIDLYTS